MKKDIKITALALAFLVAGVFSFAGMADVASAANTAKKPGKVVLKIPKAKSKSSVELKWKKTSGAKGYQVYRATGSSKKFKKIKTIRKKGTCKMTDKGLKAGTKYTYKVRAYKRVKGKTVYGKYSATKSVTTKGTKEQTDPVVVEPENPQTEEPVIQEPQNPADAVSVDVIPEHPEINFSYLGTRIHIGQTWTEGLMNEIQGKTSGMEKATREKIYYLSTVKNGRITDSAPFDVDIYFFDIGDYDNFLIVYVARGQILQWITNMADMGANGNAHMLRGCSDEEIPFSGTRYFRNILNITYPNAPEAKQGVLLGGFRFAVERDSAGNQILGLYENTAYKQNIPVEKRVAFHMVNAFRYLHGNQPLQYSMEFDGTGMTYTGYCVIQEKYYENQVFGAQAWAETMNASKKCDHLGPMPYGPLATESRESGGSKTGLVEDYFKWELMEYGDNVGGMLRPYGELVVDNYEASPGHIYTMLLSDVTHFAIGISGKYHTELYIGKGVTTKPDNGEPAPIIKYNQWEASSDY